MLRKYLDLFIVVYLDDILIYLKMKENYVKQVQLILQVLKKVNLRIKSEKSVFYTKRVQFLEFILILKELQMNSKKVRFITKSSTLINIKKV